MASAHDRACLGELPPSGGEIVGIPRHHAAVLASSGSRRAPSHQYSIRGMIKRGNCLPLVLTPPGTLHVIYILISLHNCYFTGPSETCDRKNSRNKNTHPCRLSTAVNPAKRGAKRTRIELTAPDFRTGDHQLITRARSTSPLGARGSRLPFWERAASPLAPGLIPFASRLGATQWTWALAHMGMYCVKV